MIDKEHLIRYLIQCSGNKGGGKKTGEIYFQAKQKNTCKGIDVGGDLTFLRNSKEITIASEQ